MLRNKRFQLLIILSGLFLGIAAWILWPQQLTPTEATVIGTWTTPLQPDGFATVVLLRPDRTCRVRWLDHAGEDTKRAHAPREGRWWVEGETLFVDTSVERPWFEFASRKNRAAQAWPFAIEDETLVFGQQANAPLTLRRSPDAPP